MLFARLYLLVWPVLAGPRICWEGRLVNDLLHVAHPHVRPKLDSLQAVEIRIDYLLSAINEVNEKAQSISFDGIVKSAWKDELLLWDPEEYGNLSVVYLPADLIWTPGFVFENAVGDRFYDTSYFLLRVTNDGTVMWDAGGPMTLLCEFDLTLYPFDVQVCSVELSTWSGTTDAILLMAGSLDFHRYFSGRGEWALLDSWSENQTFKEDNLAFSEAHFYIRMKRKSLYHVFSIVLPIVLLSILDCLVFVLPIDSTEKISMSVTVLLAFAVLQISFNENLPNNKDYLTLLEIYIYTFMILSTLTVTAAVLIIRLKSIDENKPLPYLVNKFTTLVLRRKGDLRPPRWTDFAEATDELVFLIFLVIVVIFTTIVISVLVHA